MARKTFEMSFQIGGKLASSFSSTFSGVNNRLTDLSNQARQTQRALDDLNRDFRKGKIEQEQYKEATERLTRQLAKLETQQKSIQGLKTTAASGVATAKTAAGIATFGVAAATAGVALKSLNTAADFNQQMAKTAILAGASEEELQRLTKTALELGAKSSLTASEVALAMGELGAKGMDANKIIGAMPGIIAAAEASGEELALTSDVVTSALNAFGLEAEKASHVADVMAMSANATAAGVADLGHSFKYAAPVAKTLGISLEELAASTGIMVDKGLTGEQAGTSLRMALIRLSKPPSEAAKALDKLNIKVTDSQGKFKSLATLAEDWARATENLSDTQKVQYAATVFGTEAATGMLNLFSAGPEVLNELTKALENSTGAAKEAADAMKDNYAGALMQLKSSIETAQITFMTPILPVFQDVFEKATSTIEGNVSKFEMAGERVAAGLRDIFEPFTMMEPIKPDPKQVVNIEAYEAALKKYELDMEKYKKFSGMDFGDKVVYMLDEATAKASAWLDGPGGENMHKIFVKLGEIAANAWFNAFTGVLKTSVSNLAQGNIGAGLGLGAVAWALGGGILLKGGIGLGRMAGGIVKGGGFKSPFGKLVPTTVAPSIQPPKATMTTPPTQSLAQKAGNITTRLGNVGKVLGKTAVPVAAAATVIEIIKSDDKPRAVASGVGGLAAGVAGAKMGAAIGTAIAPGIGTAIGTTLGGLAGYLSGKWAGGKIVDSTKQSTQQLAPKNNLMTELDTSLKASTDTLKTNLDTLAGRVEEAGGWLESLNSIQTAGKRVEQALHNLEMRINNIQLPNFGGNARVSYNG